MTSTPSGKVAVDPVCGMEVDTATSRHSAEYRGRTYWFCSLMCKNAFEDDPNRYVQGLHGSGTSER